MAGPDERAAAAEPLAMAGWQVLPWFH